MDQSETYYTHGWIVERDEDGKYVTDDGRHLTWDEVLRDVAENGDNTDMVDEMANRMIEKMVVELGDSEVADLLKELA